jgi:hypothetical protein
MPITLSRQKTPLNRISFVDLFTESNLTEMSTRLLYFGLLLPLFFSCSEEPVVTDEIIVNQVEAVIPEEDTFDYDTLKGMYIGDFGGSDIRLILNYVSQKKAIGYDIHKGLQRNLNGNVTRSGDSVYIVLNEPGDNEFDGVFTLSFVGNGFTPTGVWESNSGKIPKQNFKLSKMIKPDLKDDDEINFANFADHFGYLSDSIGDYQFKDDGLCIFEYYPKSVKDDNEGNEYTEARVEQLIEVRGTWSLNDKEVTIDWQPNKVFQGRKMILEIVETEWGEITLEGDNHEFYNHYYGP